MSLSNFLLENRHQYLESIGAGSSKDWTVVMGNEAGDLDSIASSLAYSWAATTVKKSPTIALIQTLRGDLKLRPENIHAFSLASFSLDLQELLCIDDLPEPASTSFPSNKFALVDHNHLLTRFQNVDGAKVVAVLDHHEDEGLYKDTADPRTIVVPTGSATSLVTQYIQDLSPEQIPPELATLLLCGILVDTGGLKIGGKAEQIDREAATYLYPRSTLASSLSASSTGEASPEITEIQTIKSLTQDLFDKKSNVAHLSSMDLLRRDYKQYEWTCHWTDGRTIQVGLSTVPLGLKPWLSRDLEQFWNSVDEWMNERRLDVLGILTSFSKEKKHHGEVKRKHKRQLLFVIKEIPEGGIADRLWEGLETFKELELEERSIEKYSGHKMKGGGVRQRIARAYKQGNTKATRKVVAPLVKRIIEEDPVLRAKA